ncbi:hypothetical protein PR003_g7500 [Phytophthora rubi]|uniref:Uncharacterized protein n=1 Tax=Phytophthora rubi TaxID=129364 RepID=A0A6A4FLN9_9STRA|nr:hypothetical protein PR003_g7500 [Phytophthora rubi]
MANDQKLDAALEQGDQLQLNACEQRADLALDEMLLDQGLNSHRFAPELDADLVLDDASCARTWRWTSCARPGCWELCAHHELHELRAYIELHELQELDAAMEILGRRRSAPAPPAAGTGNCIGGLR